MTELLIAAAMICSAPGTEHVIRDPAGSNVARVACGKDSAQVRGRSGELLATLQRRGSALQIRNASGRLMFEVR